MDVVKHGGNDATFRDRNLAGFGIRVHATVCKPYIVRSREPAGLKRASLRLAGDATDG